MMSFRGRRLRDLAVPTATVWLLTDLAEARGRQELYTRQSPQVLKALREAALVQSAESSNRIEGVTVDPARLRPLVLGNARPRDRSEEEVQAYRHALELLHTKANDLPVTPETIQLFHRTCQAGAGDAGEWKRSANDIVELREGQPPRVRFRPTGPAETPAAMDELCRAYRNEIDQGGAQPLIVAGALIFDFLCGHPFRDGNGRLSRLLTLQVVYHLGYEVGRYISLEKLVEDSREEYYEALARSSVGWHEGQHDLYPWLNYWLTIIRRAYRVFEERAGQVKAKRGAKRQMIIAAIESRVGPFTTTEIEDLCPSVSRDTVRAVMRELRDAGRIEMHGGGRGSRWRKRG
jgi:Fic family protein